MSIQAESAGLVRLPHKAEVKSAAAWSRITKYICSSSTPNLLSVLDPTSLAFGSAAVHITARKQNYLLSKLETPSAILLKVFLVCGYVPKTGFEPACP